MSETKQTINWQDRDSWELLDKRNPCVHGFKYIGTDIHDHHVIHIKGRGYYSFDASGGASLGSKYSVRPLSPASGTTPNGRAVEFRQHDNLPGYAGCWWMCNDCIGYVVCDGSLVPSEKTELPDTPNQWPIPNRAAVLAKIDELVDAEEAKAKADEGPIPGVELWTTMIAGAWPIVVIGNYCCVIGKDGGIVADSEEYWNGHRENDISVINHPDYQWAWRGDCRQAILNKKAELEAKATCKPAVQVDPHRPHPRVTLWDVRSYEKHANVVKAVRIDNRQHGYIQSDGTFELDNEVHEHDTPNAAISDKVAAFDWAKLVAEYDAKKQPQEPHPATLKAGDGYAGRLVRIGGGV